MGVEWESIFGGSVFGEFTTQKYFRGWPYAFA